MHEHSFEAAAWPFDEPTNVAAYTTRFVLDDALPILLVTHDEDGAWQVLCGTTNDPDDGRIACLACLFAREPSIGALADLPYGWRAWRDSPTSSWQRELRLPSEDE